MNEVWKEYPLEYDYENPIKLEFSNYGRVRTTNLLHPEGKIINGALQNGFPIVRLKLFKPRTELQNLQIAAYNEFINALSAEIKLLGSTHEEFARKLELRAKRDAQIKKRSTFIRKSNNARAINFAVLVHKAVALLFIPKPNDPAKKFVIHKDFNKENNAAYNLAWASQEDLNHRMVSTPKMVEYRRKRLLNEVKPNTSMGKLSESDVLYIKQRLKKGDTLRKLAKRFDVSDMQIHRIKTGENWSHIKLVEDLVEQKENKKWQAT